MKSHFANLLKQLKPFFIYDMVIVLLLSLYYVAISNEDWLFFYTVFVYLPLIYIPFFSAPVIGHFIGKNEKTTLLSSLEMNAVIYIVTFLTMCIPRISNFFEYGFFDGPLPITDFIFHASSCIMCIIVQIACVIHIIKRKLAKNKINQNYISDELRK